MIVEQSWRWLKQLTRRNELSEVNGMEWNEQSEMRGGGLAAVCCFPDALQKKDILNKQSFCKASGSKWFLDFANKL
ncbi:MAG: hypothetical protein M3Z26_00345 [Bacteroidota bacterium]|nr:hypothetical protein [Bacteroidota bacterium]